MILKSEISNTTPELYYQSYGDGSAKDVLVYFHGLPGSRLEGSLTNEAALALNLHVIAFDRPGFGKSVNQEARSITSVAHSVRRLLDRLGIDRCGVLALSGGAPYALGCCAVLGPRISQAAIVSGMGRVFNGSGKPFFAKTMHWANRCMLQGGVLAPRTTHAFITFLVASWKFSPLLMLAWFDAILSREDKLLLARKNMRKLMRDNMYESLRQNSRGALEDFRQLCRPWDVDLSKIVQTITFWHGDTDDYVPIVYAEELVKVLPNAQLRVVPQGGHFMVLKIISEVLRDLKNNMFH